MYVCAAVCVVVEVSTRREEHLRVAQSARSSFARFRISLLRAPRLRGGKYHRAPYLHNKSLYVGAS